MHEPERATIAPQKRGRSVPLIGCMPSENGSAPRGCRARGRVGMLLELIMPRTTDLDPEIAEHIVVTTCGARAASLAELRALRALPTPPGSSGTVQPEGGHCDTWSDAREARACKSRAWRSDHPTQPQNGPADAQRR